MNIPTLGTSLLHAYYTPNLQFEILFGALLQPYIAGIIEWQSGRKMEYVTSELPFRDNNARRGNGGPKADFMLADKDYVYLAELKTVKDDKSHSRWVEQWERYNYTRTNYLTFGEVSGIRLLDIIKDKYANKFALQDVKAPYGTDSFRLAIEEITRDTVGETYTEKAIYLLKTYTLTSSRKYLFTLAQIADYLHKFPRNLWDMPVKLIYILPNDFEAYKKNDKNFYERLYGNCLLINLPVATSWLREEGGYAKELADAINNIYNMH